MNSTSGIVLTTDNVTFDCPEDICAALDYAVEQAETMAAQARALKAAYLEGKAVHGASCDFVQLAGGSRELGQVSFVAK